MKHGIALMLLAILASAANAQTQFYKCKDKWGQPIFSQRPCGDNAETGTVSGPAPTGTPARTTANASAATSESSSAWDKIEAANTLREANLEKERDQNLVALQNKKRYADNNLAGATWEESISSEMQAINEQYQSKIDSQRRKIDRLQEQADRVSESL
tara:strand:- start:3423 stop:3896 length:474 start_codon:yes stop_codon:yes gene_type:complete